MSEKPYRRHDQIIREILDIAQGEGATRTKILCRAYLSFHMGQDYLAQLVKMRLLSLEGNKYVTTSKGIEWLRVHSQLADLMVVVV